MLKFEDIAKMYGDTNTTNTSVNKSNSFETVREIKDGMFRLIIKDIDNLKEILSYLIGDISLINFNNIKDYTIKESEMRKPRNDGAFCIDDILLCFIEAESINFNNTDLKMLEYASVTISNWCKDNNKDKSKSVVKIPSPVFFIVCTGEVYNNDYIRFCRHYVTNTFNAISIDFACKIITDYNVDKAPKIIQDYFRFCMVQKHIRKKYNKNLDNADDYINELVKWCEQNSCLIPFINNYIKDVKNVLNFSWLFTDDVEEAREEGKREGKKEIMDLLSSIAKEYNMSIGQALDYAVKNNLIKI